MYVNVAHMAHVHLACNKFLIYTVKVHVVCTCMLHTVLVVHARTWLFTAMFMQVANTPRDKFAYFGNWQTIVQGLLLRITWQGMGASM